MAKATTPQQTTYRPATEFASLASLNEAVAAAASSYNSQFLSEEG